MGTPHRPKQTVQEKFSMAVVPEVILHRGNEKNYMEVIDQGGVRSLYFNKKVVQSRISLEHPQKLLLKYTQFLMGAALLACPSPKKVLIIGVGAGALFQFLHHYFPDCKVEGVDYSLQIIKLARGYFGLPENDNITIHHSDGLGYLRGLSTDACYDIIIIDAFDDRGMAKNIYSNEFFNMAGNHLSPDGIICANLWSGNTEGLNKVKKAIHKNAKNSVYIPVHKRDNIIALLFQHELPWHDLCPEEARLRQIQAIYNHDIDFVRISKSITKNNLRIGERIQLYFSNKA